MSYYALTLQGLQGMERNWWGAKIPMQWDPATQQPVEGAPTMDTGVQQAITELINRMSSTAPIQLGGTLQLIAPPNGPAISISNSDGSQITYITEENITQVNNTTNVTNVTNITEGGTTSGFTGTITVVTAVAVNTASGSVSVSGCTGTVSITLTLTVTTLALTYVNGLLTSAT